MKKIIAFILVITLSLSLCGCSFKEAVSAEANEYMVTAMGFDAESGKIKIFLETIMINSEDSEADKKTELLEGEGNTAEEAFQQAYKKTAQPLMLSHLGVAAIGGGISGERFEEILKFCYDIDEINISIFWVAAESAKELLSCEAVSSVAVGYDIMSMITEQGSRTGADFKNRFYELEAASAQPLNIISLPYFITEEKSFLIDGLMIFKENSPVMRLDSEQSALYAIATDTQGAGDVFLKGREYKIKSSYSHFTFSDKTLNPELYMDLRLEGKNDADEIKSEIKKLFDLSKAKGADIFGIGNILYRKKPNEWKKIKDNYETFYKNSKLTVKMQ